MENSELFDQIKGRMPITSELKMDISIKKGLMILEMLMNCLCDNYKDLTTASTG